MRLQSPLRKLVRALIWFAKHSRIKHDPFLLPARHSIPNAFERFSEPALGPAEGGGMQLPRKGLGSNSIEAVDRLAGSPGLVMRDHHSWGRRIRDSLLGRGGGRV